MSFQTFVTERLAAITTALNAIGTNAKKIDELPIQSTLDPASKIHVSRGGTSESVTIQKVVDSVVEKTFSQLLSIGDVTVSGLVLNIPSGASWIYGGTNYATVADTNIPETLCEVGYLRTDILVANQLNQIVLIKGNESETIRIQPNTPIGTVFISEIDVDDTVIGIPSVPIINGDYIPKVDKSHVLLQGSGVIDFHYFGKSKYNSIVFDGTYTSFGGVSYVASSNALFPGRKLTLRNNQSTAITLVHNSSLASVKLMFPNLVDFVLKPKEVIEFIYRINTNASGWYDYIGIINAVSSVEILDVDGLTEELADRYTKSEADVLLGSKLDSSAYNQHFKGKYTSSGALTTAHPAAIDGDYAIVDSGIGVDAKEWIWDNEAGWIVGGATGASTTDALPEGSTNLYWTVARFLYNLTYANVIAALGFTPSTAPNNAQKNSDITKAEIEAELTGEITSHTHPSVGAGGDMVLASVQEVSGLKTFLAGKFGLRNIANTFTSLFTNANTAARTYTLQNRDGTLLDNTDLTAINASIATKMANPSGTANYLSKFLTATTIGISRLWDTGTFFGIGTVNTPTKDITLGNQNAREFGVEQSSSTVVGQDLTISAGRTINFVDNANFVGLNQTVRAYDGVAVDFSNNVYAVASNDIYKQTNNTGNFISMGYNITALKKIAFHSNGNVYAVCDDGKIYMQTAGTGSFNLIQTITPYLWGLAIASNGNVYVSSEGGDIYKQTNGTGSFVALGQTSRTWRGLAAAPNGNIYATVSNGDVYMQTAGTGNFVALGQTSRVWWGIAAATNGDIYATVNNGDIYKQTNGTGSFVALGQTSRVWYALAVNSIGDVYATVNGGDIYKKINNALGTENLDGGTLKNKAGTGKGTGKSRWEVWTGQKLTSGTDMQTETLREYVDENGYHIYVSIPIYADDAAADADTNLPQGASYKLTGNRTIFHKP